MTWVMDPFFLGYRTGIATVVVGVRPFAGPSKNGESTSEHPPRDARRTKNNNNNNNNDNNNNNHNHNDNDNDNDNNNNSNSNSNSNTSNNNNEFRCVQQPEPEAPSALEAPWRSV